MTLSADHRMTVDEFREYVEDAVAPDERYGPPIRWEAPDGSVLVSRFDAGGRCWFEVAVHAGVPSVQVGLLAADPEIAEDIKATIAEVEGGAADWLAENFAEAGLDWSDPPVETGLSADNAFRVFTTLTLEYLSELESGEVRDQVLRMLEGYFIAFGPVLEPTEPFEPIDEGE